MACPICGSLEPFDIVGDATFKVYDAGSYEFRDLEWAETSLCTCLTCKTSSVVWQTKRTELARRNGKIHFEVGKKIWIYPYLQMDEARGVQAEIKDTLCPSCGKFSLVDWRDDQGNEYTSCLNDCCPQLSYAMGAKAD